MKAIAVMQGGTPVGPNVEVIDIPEVTPGPGELRVRTEGAALNHLDLWVGAGLPGVDRPYPRVTGSDGVGVVDAVGQGVDATWIGRRVMMNAAVEVGEPAVPDSSPAGEVLEVIGEHRPGSLAEAFLVPATNVVDIGDTDPIQAAAFGLAHLTAWRMATTRGDVRPGEVVLIPGIGGGVALAALGICRHLGARVLVTSRHREKLDRAMALGAADAFLDEGDDWSRSVRMATGRRGVDVCLDSVGKAIHGSCIRSLARGGRFVTCGCTSGSDATTDLARVFWNQLSLHGSTMGDRQEFREVSRLFLDGRLSPVIDAVVAPEEAASQFSRLESGLQFGKLVVDWRRGSWMAAGTNAR
jgi:NADPH:quinone reductase-like Zn-dependent oxidoreductase